MSISGGVASAMAPAKAIEATAAVRNTMYIFIIMGFGFFRIGTVVRKKTQTASSEAVC